MTTEYIHTPNSKVSKQLCMDYRSYWWLVLITFCAVTAGIILCSPIQIILNYFVSPVKCIGPTNFTSLNKWVYDTIR